MLTIIKLAAVSCIFGFLISSACAAVVKVDEAAVNAAIERGKAYLLTRQDATGLFEGDHKKEIGSTALVVCALRKAGVPADHEVIKKAFPHLLKYADSNLAIDEKLTYNAGCVLLALDAMRKGAAGSSAGDPQDKQLRAAAEKLAALLLKNQGNRGGWHYFNKRDGDMSTTQYGGLGLWAAERLGLPIPRNVWDSLNSYVMKVHQHEGGGFAYHDVVKKSEKATHTMTAAGIGTLSIAQRQATKKEIVREVLVSGDDYYDGTKKEKKEVKGPPVVAANQPKTDVEKAIERGFNALKVMEFESKNAYYWYALERACTLTGTKVLGGAPWFEVLCKQILPAQKENGSWINGHDATCDTAWAVLALTRATGKMINPEQYDSYDEKPAVAGKPAQKGEPKTEAASAKPGANAAKPKSKPDDE